MYISKSTSVAVFNGNKDLEQSGQSCFPGQSFGFARPTPNLSVLGLTDPLQFRYGFLIRNSHDYWIVHTLKNPTVQAIVFLYHAAYSR